MNLVPEHPAFKAGYAAAPAMAHAVTSIRFSHNGKEITVVGRCSWALLRLLEAREKGCTPITEPAPRWSAYVFKLRRLGLDVETITEEHGGPYAGSHARYVLRSTIEVLEVGGAT
jgi:hypothetical protein